MRIYELSIGTKIGCAVLSAVAELFVFNYWNIYTYVTETYDAISF